jgi:nucleotide-binding universal stress UspA family protein
MDRGATATIVLGVDDDDRVAELVERAAQLAAEQRTLVLMVHVVHRSEIWALATVMVDSKGYLRASRRRLERTALAPLRARGVDARLIVRLGEPAHQLARVASVAGADRIVIGAEHHDRKHHLIGGGVARRLEHLTPVPVVVVAPAIDDHRRHHGGRHHGDGAAPRVPVRTASGSRR